MDDPIRNDALRLLRAARDYHVEQHGDAENSFRARTTLDLAAAGQRTGLPIGYPSYEDAVVWLEDRSAIEPDPLYQFTVGGPIYLITQRGLALLAEE